LTGKAGEVLSNYSNIGKEMAEVKGILLRSGVLYLKKLYGDKEVNTAINELDPEDQVLLPSVLLDSNWYPFDIWRAMRRLSRKLDTAFPAVIAHAKNPNATTNLALDMGKFMAQHAFTGIYRPLLAKTPIKQVEKFPLINDLFYKDTRKVEVKLLSDTSAFVRYTYEPGVNPRHSTCLSSMGIWVRSLELAGAKNVKAVHTKCIVDKKDFCEFTFEWR
jgi:hypothetical protein